jgi:hypothetical protein
MPRQDREGGRGMKRSKMNVDTSNKGKVRRTVDGIVFDSELEAKYYREVIRVGMKDGTIFSIQTHPKYRLQDGYEKYGRKHQAVYYEADFEIVYASKDVEIVDVKGMPTETALLKRKWFDKKYPDILRWICYSKQDGGWIDYDELIKRRKERKKGKVHASIMRGLNEAAEMERGGGNNNVHL